MGSVSEAVSADGTSIVTQLYGPYGAVRYSSGALPTGKGYTGQRADAVSGLDYYNARYYDPAAGQFASADSDSKGGLNRYAYVGGNPETHTDPTGHRPVDGWTNDDTTLAIDGGQVLVGAGRNLDSFVPLYKQMVRNTAHANYKAAKNSATHEQGRLTQAELEQLQAERNAEIRAGDATVASIEGAQPILKWMGRGMMWVGAGFDAYLSGQNQWNNDASGHYSEGQRWARAATAGVVHAALDTALSVVVADGVDYGVTALAGVIFSETGPADPFIMAAVFAGTSAVMSGGGAALVTSAAAPIVDYVSSGAADLVGSLFG